MQNHPLDNVVVIQRVVAFTPTKSVKGLFELAYVNNSWNDTIKNYSFLQDRVDLPRLVCRTDSSPATLQLVFDKIVQVGGMNLLHRQITSTSDHGENCLMVASRDSSSPDVINLIIEKIVEIGGKDLLTSQAAATDRLIRNSLMIGCCFNSSSPKVMKLLFERIGELCGKEVLKSLISSNDKYGVTCLMVACRYCSVEVLKFIFEKIVEVDGPEFLEHLLTRRSTDGLTCMMHACWNPSSPEVMKLLLEKIIEAGGLCLLKTQLIAQSVSGGTCLMHWTNSKSSPKVMTLLATVLFELHLFKDMYSKLSDSYKMKFRETTEIKHDSWVPTEASLSELTEIAGFANAKEQAEAEAVARKKAVDEAWENVLNEGATTPRRTAEEEAGLNRVVIGVVVAAAATIAGVIVFRSLMKKK